MLLRTASPIRRDGSSVHYLRKRVPADLTDRAVGLVLHVPVGDETAEVQVGRNRTIKVSLRTHDPREAKARQAKALAYLDDVWRSMRENPRRLSHREIIALAGEAYRHAKKTWENDPGRATLWNMLHQAALKWDPATAQGEMAPYVAELLSGRRCGSMMTVQPVWLLPCMRHSRTLGAQRQRRLWAGPRRSAVS